MVQDQTITLSVKEAGERPNATYLFHVFLNGNTITSNQSLSLPDSRAVAVRSPTALGLFSSRAACRKKMLTPSEPWERSSSTSG